MADKIPVAVLGATGSVGQRFIQLLDQHPWFQVVALFGSERSQEQRFVDACQWKLTDPMPVWAQNLRLKTPSPEELQARIVFSALPASSASELEPLFAKAGAAVCSNASSFRRDADVPLLLPEVNPDHIQLVEVQRRKRGWSGCILTNPNCTSTGLTVALKALQDAFGVRKAIVVSLQALSGAGYPGVASLDVVDNVIPYIAGEEDKVEWEPRKMLAHLSGDSLRLAEIQISAHTNRVAVSDGHLVCVSLELEQKAETEEIRRILQDYQAPLKSRDLPSSPRPPLCYTDQEDRPQPRLDRMTGLGMSTVVGRLRHDPILDIKFVVLSHNTIRGAAGGSIYNAELLVSQGLL